jgi:drug/metabolite transporter (DMT)-like permease
VGLVVLAVCANALALDALSGLSIAIAALIQLPFLALVVGASALLGRERVDARRAAALVAILTGVALVGGGAVSPDPLGLALALAAAAVYAVQSVDQRHERTGKWGFSGQEMQTIHRAITLADALLLRANSATVMGAINWLWHNNMIESTDGVMA